MAPCNLSHCHADRYHCHFYGCKVELLNRLDRRYETRDDLKKRLKTEKANIALLKQQVDHECGPTAQQNSFMRRAQQSYDAQMSKTTIKKPSRCTECAVSEKDDEIALLRKKIEAAESFQDFLREYPRTPRYVRPKGLWSGRRWLTMISCLVPGSGRTPTSRTRLT